MWVCNVLLKVKNLLGCLHLLRVFFSLLRKRGVESKCFRFPPFFALPFDSKETSEDFSLPRGVKSKTRRNNKGVLLFWKISRCFFVYFCTGFIFFSFLRHGLVDYFLYGRFILSHCLTASSRFISAQKVSKGKVLLLVVQVKVTIVCVCLCVSTTVNSKNCGPLGTCAQRDSGRWCHRYDSPPSATTATSVQRFGSIKCTVSFYLTTVPPSLLSAISPPPSFWITSSNGQNDARNI